MKFANEVSNDIRWAVLYCTAQYGHDGTVKRRQNHLFRTCLFRRLCFVTYVPIVRETGHLCAGYVSFPVEEAGHMLLCKHQSHQRSYEAVVYANVQINPRAKRP